MSPEESNGIVGVHAVRATAVGDHLAGLRKASNGVLEGVDRNRSCTRDVTGSELGGGPDVEEDDSASDEALGQLSGVDLHDRLGIAEIPAGQHLDLADVRSGDVSQRCPQLRNAIAGKAVHDPLTLPARLQETGVNETTEMMRRVGNALVDLTGDPLN